MSAQLKGEKVYRGTAVSAGVCRGKVLVFHRTRHLISQRSISDAEVADEIKRFEQVLVKTRTQIKEVQRRVVKNMSASEADIFDAHLLMLEDRVLIDEVIRLIREQKANADFAFHEVSGRYVAVMEGVEDDYLRERASDMKDLMGRVLDNLLEIKDSSDLKHLNEPCILVSHDLSPSTTAQLDKKLVLGFATDIGGKSSHTAIMARSLDIPAVVGLQTISEELENGDYVLLDGYNGTVIVNPTDATLFEYGQLAKLKGFAGCEAGGNPLAAGRDARRQSRSTFPRTSKTSMISRRCSRTGRRAWGFSAPNFCSSTAPARRTRKTSTRFTARWPRRCKPHHVIIRTLDLGGDKFVSSLQLAPEMNSFLGWRAIRFCLAQPESVLRATPRHPARQRRGQRQDDVPDDFRPGRIEPGQRAGRKMQGRVAREKNPVQRKPGNRRDD